MHYALYGLLGFGFAMIALRVILEVRDTMRFKKKMKRWDAIHQEYFPRALRAKSVEELDQVYHEMDEKIEALHREFQ